MKRLIKGFYMALSMFCAVPMPKLWDETCTGIMMPCLPVVGSVIGAIWWGVARLLALLGLHTALAAAIIAFAPFFITGYIHLDGLMDTSDAVLSRRPLEEKIRILKDPHTGAFAVITLVIALLTQYSASFAVIEKQNHLSLLIMIPVVSRCGSAISVLCLKPARYSGYVSIFRQNTGAAHKVFTIAAAVAAIILAYVLAGVSGAAVIMVTALGYTAAMAYAYSGFRFVSGDLAGFALVVSELCGLIALAVI